MIVTPKMWELKQRIEFLEHARLCNPGDYMVEFELGELKIKYNKLERREALGLQLIHGGQASDSSTPRARRKHLK